MPIVELLPGLLFVASSGIFFSERFRRNRILVVGAGCIALVSTYFLTVQIIDQIVAHRIGEGSNTPAAVAQEGLNCLSRDAPLYAEPDLQAPIRAHLASGSVVGVLNSENGWRRVSTMTLSPTPSRGEEGYLRGDVLRPYVFAQLGPC